MDTNYGKIKIELFLEKSPITAGNFKTLVESGFYDRTKFHRVIDGFMIQGGDPLSKDNTQLLSWGTGGSETIIEDEFIEGLSNKKGYLSMANSGPNTGSSQFFINLQDNTFLDWDKAPASSKHPVFGQIVEGMEIIELIGKVETNGQPYNRPEEHVIITSAVISAE
jgi:peptidylprolyl isomerase